MDFPQAFFVCGGFPIKFQNASEKKFGRPHPTMHDASKKKGYAKRTRLKPIHPILRAPSSKIGEQIGKLLDYVFGRPHPDQRGVVSYLFGDIFSFRPD